MVKMRKNKVLVGLSLLALSLSLVGCRKSSAGNNQQAYMSAASNSKIVDKNTNSGGSQNFGGITNSEYSKLANETFKSGTYGYIEVNNGHSTLNPTSWQQNKVIYQKLDRYNRASSSNTAFLEKRNLANDSLRVRQTVQPTGWHYNTRNGEQLYNRGHLIAYSVSAGIDQNGEYNPNNVSGDQNNPKNLFTQSAYSNQQLQTIYESKIRKALRANKKVIFQATPIFKGNEKMARGINLQAISTDKTLDFNVYIFNIQPNYAFDYATGGAKKDNSVQVKELPTSLQSHYNDNQKNSQSNYSKARSSRSFGHYLNRESRRYWSWYNIYQRRLHQLH